MTIVGASAAGSCLQNVFALGAQPPEVPTLADMIPIMRNPGLLAPLVTVGIVMLIGGCGSYSPEYGDLIDNQRPAPEPYVPEEQPGWTPDEGDVPEAVSSWTCSYDATFNDDWHDDVVCINGTDAQRPYLREWDDFVTEAELMESAREYEAELNLGG